jgi:hypothetical protein
MSHLESLIAEYLDWQGYIVRRNIKVGRLSHGGWEMELDIVGYHPSSNTIFHYEPSIDALSWEKREARYLKKFNAGKKYIFTEVFSWLSPETPLKQVAVFISRPREKSEFAGGTLISIDELMSEIRAKVVTYGPMCRSAISEQYPLLRTLQMTHSGYYKAI